jgi:UDP-2,3-diacylglucosamine pyrophosphatase LpxH
LLLGAAPKESLIVLSDVHLGNDLNDHVQPPGFGKRSRDVDADLVRLLDHYAKTRPPKTPRWRLVIAGDFIDFIGITLLPKGHVLATEPSEEELEHGLGNAADHARAKLLRVEERHREVFIAMARFVARGHALTMVHGNHDVELYWDSVQGELRSILLRHALEADPSLDRRAFDERIEFHPWFFYEDGLAYIEHGHQYDPLCASEQVLAPVSPRDPRRIKRGCCDVLLRFVVRPTRGMREHGHQGMGLIDYVAFGARLGIKGLFRLAVGFFSAVLELYRVHKESISDAAKTLRQEHDRRMGLLAEAKRIGIDRLRALAALQVPPITRSVSGILASVLLDRLALGMLSSLALVVVGLLGFWHGYLWPGAVCVLVAWVMGHRWLTRHRPKLDYDDELVERAGRLVKLFPAAFVVMGHTHTPMELPVAEGQATYVNVGSWSESEPAGDEEHTYRAARTHLVIHPGEDGAKAEFLAWSAEGPRRFVSEKT